MAVRDTTLHDEHDRERTTEADRVMALAVDQLAEEMRDVSVAKALGSSTRADIYAHLRRADSALSVREVAAVFDLHPNVVRTHLETLADAGLVSVGRRKNQAGGRPAKVYVARARPELASRDTTGWSRAAGLLVQLLAALLPGEQATDARVVPLRRKAYERAHAEGRRIVADVASDAQAAVSEEDLSAAAERALHALRPYAPQARVVRSGAGWVDCSGFAGMFDVLTPHRPSVADALERGLVAGALAGCGATVTVVDAGTQVDGAAVWRVRAVTGGSARGPVSAAASIDTRGLHREAGVVRAMRAVTALRGGEVLEVLTEGPGSPAAFARWADRAGHQLLGVERAADEGGRAGIRLLIRKGP